mmetsp:Transcript_26740/g.42368  ORF Transcript_26740/g.42368 Transcript_26740/m.42368 type:complete len:210 (+) Transcript_26740:105-734(+)
MISSSLSDEQDSEHRLIHILHLQRLEINQQAHQRDGKQIPISIENITHRVPRKEGEAQRAHIEGIRRWPTDIVLDRQRMREHGDGGGPAAEDQHEIHAVLLLCRGSIEEPNVVQIEANVVLGPNIKRLGCVRGIEIEVGVLSRRVAAFQLERVSESRFRKQRTRQIRQEHKEHLHRIRNICAQPMRVICPLEEEQRAKEDILDHERVRQ